MKIAYLPLLMALGATQTFAQAQPGQSPVIDMHLHASLADENAPPPLGLCIPLSNMVPHFDPKVPFAEVFMEAFRNPQCPDPIWSPRTDEELFRRTVAQMEKYNVTGVLSGPPVRVLEWSSKAPGRFIPSIQLQIGRDHVSPDSIRALVKRFGFKMIGEISNQYAGIAPNDARMDPYWSVAQELDIPVAIHLGGGPPGAPYVGDPRYEARLSSPYLLEDVLKKFPRLRVSVMHYGEPLIDEMIAMLYTYPQVYIDLGGIQWAYPAEYFYSYHLKKFIDAGFGKRILFGSDAQIWPEVIGRSIRIIQEAPFLNERQKRDILYNNSARFLRLDQP